MANDPNRSRRTRKLPPLAGGGQWGRATLAASALTLLAIASYLPAMLWGGFVWDDFQHIVNEPALRDAAGLARFWFAPAEVHEPFYRPLTYTTFWLEHQLWGLDPTGYHVVNVLLHAANGLLLWGILARLAVPGAWLIAAVFAVHPLHVESVAWAIERKDVLSGLFYLACLWVWLPFLEGARPERAPARYGLALLLFAAGLLAKNMVVTLPAALVVLHWWRHGRVALRDVLWLLPLFALALAFAALDLAVVGAATPASFDHGLVERALIAARAVWFYVGKLSWPADLAVIYPRWEVGVGDVVGWVALAAAAALVALLWRLRGRIGRGPLAGGLFFAVTLAPTLGFVDHTYMLFAFVADRYQYLAGIGVIAVLVGTAVVLATRLPAHWRPATVGTAATALLLLGALTWRQAGIYRDQLTFFEHVVGRNPTAVGAHLNLAQALIDAGRLEDAAAAGRIAVAQDPDAYDPRINLAVALAELGRLDEAETHLRRAVAIAPSKSSPHANLGVLLSRQGELEASERHLRRALELAPRDRDVLRNLAKLLTITEQLEDALALYDRLVQQGAGDAATYTARGDLLIGLGRRGEALAAWQQALSAAPPPNAALKLHLAMGPAEWAHSGNADAAARHYERALAIQPRHVPALSSLASLRIAQERYEDALALLGRALEQAGEATAEAAPLHAGRGYALYRLGQTNAAIASLDRALALDPTQRQAREHLALARQSQQ